MRGFQRRLRPVSRDQLSGLAAGAAAQTSITATWSVNPVPGSKVLFGVAVGSGSAVTVSSVVDNGTTVTTFTQDAVATSGTGVLKVYIYRGENITLPSAGSYSVTATWSPSGQATAGGISYLGLAAGGPTATNTGNATSTSVSTGAVTAGNLDALYFANFTDGDNNETITLTWAGATEQFSEPTGVTFTNYGQADLIATGDPAAQTGTWTASGGAVWHAAIAVYDAQPYVSPVPSFTAAPPRRAVARWFSAQVGPVAGTGRFGARPQPRARGVSRWISRPSQAPVSLSVPASGRFTSRPRPRQRAAARFVSAPAVISPAGTVSRQFAPRPRPRPPARAVWRGRRVVIGLVPVIIQGGQPAPGYDGKSWWKKRRLFRW